MFNNLNFTNLGYGFWIISKEKPITKEHYDLAILNMSEFNKTGGALGGRPCDIDYKPFCIYVSGSYGISGNHAEGFVLNLLIRLIDLGYSPKVLSNDWNYGSKEDFDWLNSNYEI